MTGIYGVISQNRLGKRINLRSFLYLAQDNYLINCQGFSNADFVRCSTNKFKNDKIFQQAGDCLVSTDGVILNLKHLLKENRAKNLYELILERYKQHDCDFPKKFRGSFIGFIYFENENKLILFTDHIGSRPVFYFYDRASGTLVFGSELKTLVNILHEVGYNLHLDIEAAYCLLTFGHMLGDLTLVKEIKKVPPASVLTYTNQQFSIKKYYRLSNQPYVSDSEDNILHELAKKYKIAVQLEYTKDLEYGYNHIATLSGGLDSRTNIAFAKKLGFDDITCFTYSQSNYLDHKIAKKICHDNGFNFVFFPLDWGKHLIEYMDEIINIYGGLVFYAGICNLYPWLRKLGLEKYGLLHTGMLGGEIFEEYLRYSHCRKYEWLRYFISGKSSGDLLGQISHLIDKELSRYGSTELFKFYNIGVNAQLMAVHVINQFIDMTSPHLFLDLLNYIMRIPADYRNDKKIYTKMISVYLPEFAKYTWEHCRIPPKYAGARSLRGYGTLWSLFNRVVSRLLPFYQMNPFDYWYRKNSVLRKGVEKAFNTNINLLENYSRLKDDCSSVFEQGNFLEKTAVITLLKAVSVLGLNKILA